MSTIELKTSTKNMIDSLDMTDRRSREMLVSVKKILSVFLNNDVQQENEKKRFGRDYIQTPSTFAECEKYERKNRLA